MSTLAAIEPTAPVGTIPGSFRVSPNGEAQYQIPISIPPGTAGMQPQLDIVYNSEIGSSGLIGHGWMLQGFATITRCTLKRDGTTYAVNYTANDQYCLNGRRLVEVSTSQAGYTEYRTEIESWQKIRAYGQCGTGPCYFSVQSRDGIISEFGGSDDSRIEAVADASLSNGTIPEGSVRVWAINSRLDLNYNQIDYLYYENTETGEYLPNTIVYTSNQQASPALAPQRAISLNYIDKQAETFYQGGAVIPSTKLLNEIKTCISYSNVADGCLESSTIEVINTYKFTYRQSSFTTKKLLSSIQLIGRDGTALPETVFAWQEVEQPQFSTPNSWTRNFTSANGWSPDYQPRHLADINADGRIDIIGFANKLHYSFSSGDVKNGGFTDDTSMDPPSNLPACTTTHNCVTNYPRKLSDVNGDGRADIIGFEEHGVYTMLYEKETGSYSGTAEQWSDQLASSNTWVDRRVIDINGDNLADIIGFGENAIYFYYSNGAAFTAGEEYKIDWSKNDSTLPQLVDVNGDGISDLVGFYQQQILVALGTNNNGFLPRTIWQANFGSGWDDTTHDVRMLADVNGDKKADAIGINGSTVLVAYSTGKSFSEPVTWQMPEFGSWDNTKTQRVMGDVNGDGRADLIGYGQSKILFGIATDTGFDTSILPAITSTVGYGQMPEFLRYSSDVNGSGIASIIVFGTENVNVATPPTPKTDFLIGITNGLGAKTEITYGSLASYEATSGDSTSVDNGFYTPCDPSDFGLSENYREFRGALYVVTEVTQYTGPGEAGVDDAYTYKHLYEGSVARTDQTGFLGFEKHSTLDLQVNSAGSYPGLFHISEFKLSFTNESGEQINAQRPLSQSVAINVGTSSEFTLHKTDYELAVRETHPKVNFIYPTKEVTYNYSLNSSNSYTTGKNFTFDSEGRLSVLHNAGNLTDPTDDLYQCTNYQAINDELWVDLPINQRAAHGQCIYSSGSDSCTCPIENDMPSTEIAYTEDGRLNQQYIRHSDNSNELETGEFYLWNDLGLATQIQESWWRAGTKNIITTTHYAYEGDFRSFIFEISNPIYSTYLSTDPAYGIVVSQTDANSVTRKQFLDGFGRVVRAQAPDLLNGSALTDVMAQSWGVNESGQFYQQVSSLNDWNGNWAEQRTYYDGLSRVYRREKVLEDGSTIVSLKRYLSPTLLEAQSTPFLSTAQPNWMKQTYDTLGRLQRVDYPTGDYIQQQYDIDTLNGINRSNGTSYLYKANGSLERKVTSYSDSFGNILQRNLPGVTDSETPEVAMNYDALGRMTYLLAADGSETRFQYDSLSRLQAQSSDVKGLTDWHYNFSGMLARVSYASGSSLNFTYDELLREKTRTMTNSTEQRVIEFTYDNTSAGNFGIGRLWKVDDSQAGQMQFSYDADGNANATTLDIDGYTFSINRLFDPKGRVLTKTFSDVENTGIINTYGVGGELLNVNYCANKNQCSAQNYTELAHWGSFNAFQRAQSVTFNNGVTEAWTFDSLGRRSNVQVALAGDALLDNTYTWDGLHNIEKVEDAVDSAFTEQYSYYPPGYVKTAILGDSTNGQSLTYEYDIGGSLIKKTVSGSENSTTIYDVSDQKLVNVNHENTAGATEDNYNWTVDYSADGRITRIGPKDDDSNAWIYQYDANGRIISATGPGLNANSSFSHSVTEKYLYDFTGQLLRRQRADGSKAYYFDPEFTLNLAGNGNVVGTRNVYGPEGIVATISSDESALFSMELPLEFSDWQYYHWFRYIYGTRAPSLVPGPNGPGIPVANEWLYFHTDTAGGTIVVSKGDGDSSEGTAWARLNYDPYGNINPDSTSTGSRGPNNTFSQKFHGFELAQDSGLYVMGNRSLLPEIGRFISPDSAVQGAAPFSAAAFNAYAFAGNNPITSVDPLGNSSASILAEVGMMTAMVSISVAAPELLPAEGAIALTVGMGAFSGAAAVNHSFNPANWNYKSWKTYAGMAAGVAISTAGAAITVAAPAAVTAAGGGESAVFLAGLAASAADGAGENVAFAALGGANQEQMRSAAWQGAVMGAVTHVGTHVATRSINGEPSFNAGCSSSFTGQTLIDTEFGLKPIKDIKLGDRVWSYAEDSGEVKLNEVTKLIQRAASSTITLIIGDEEIETTKYHPFYTKEKGWIGVEALQPGDVVLTIEGDFLPIITRIESYGAEKVFNFSVANEHNYFVSNAGFLVHNPKDEGCEGLGGLHGQTKQHSERKLVESDHFPPKSAYKGTRYDGHSQDQLPARTIPYDAHRQFITTGSSAEAKAFREKQNNLMQQGNFAEAVEMNVEAYKKGGLLKTKEDKSATSQGIEAAVNQGFMDQKSATRIRKKYNLPANVEPFHRRNNARYSPY